MFNFITTIRFTPQGTQAIKDTCKRADAFKAAAKKMGAKITGIYWTLGPFDGVILFQAKDGETATALMLQLSSLGNVQTTTARAFDAGEMQKIVGMLGK